MARQAYLREIAPRRIRVPRQTAMQPRAMNELRFNDDRLGAFSPSVIGQLGVAMQLYFDGDATGSALLDAVGTRFCSEGKAARLRPEQLVMAAKDAFAR